MGLRIATEIDPVEPIAIFVSDVFCRSRSQRLPNVFASSGQWHLGFRNPLIAQLWTSSRRYHPLPHGVFDGMQIGVEKHFLLHFVASWLGVDFVMGRRGNITAPREDSNAFLDPAKQFRCCSPRILARGFSQ